MARHSTHGVRPRPSIAVALVAVILLAATGCTICPDPFDYTGPVPNGSPPQNDFRARSNGITPLGGTPRPWPPVVQAAPDSDSDESRPELASGEEQAADEATAPEEESPVQAAATEAVPIEPDEETTTLQLPEVAEPKLDEILPPGPPARLPILPPLRETPGWRPRS